MSSIYHLQTSGQKIEQLAKDVLRDLPADTPQAVRTQIEVIEAEARLLVTGAEHLRTSIRAQVDG